MGDAIAAYLRAADTSKYNEVIAKANEVRRLWAARLAAAVYVATKVSLRAMHAIIKPHPRA